MIEPIIVREGASVRTADELALTFVDDAVSLGAKLSAYGKNVRARVEDRLEENRSPRSGVAWLDNDTLATELHWLVTEMETELSTLGYVVEWEDGYVITWADSEEE